MAFSSLSSASKVSNDSTGLKSCLETIKHLKSQNDQLLKDLKKSELIGYKTCLKAVEERLDFFTNESIYLEDIKVLKVEIQMGEIAIREHRKKLEIAQKEKDGIQLNIDFTSWNRPTFYNNDEEHFIQYKEYLENSSNAIAPVLPTEEPEYSLSMRDEHLSTIPKTKSDEVIKSSVKNLILIPRESKVTSDNESECDVPVNDESFPIFTTFSNPLFDCNDDLTSSDDESLSNEDVLMENIKIYLNPLFNDEEIISPKIDLHCFNAEFDLIESLLNQDTLIDSFPKFDYLLEEFSGELTQIDPISPGIEEADFDLEEEIRLELLNTLPCPKNESSNFDHHDDPSFPRPPLELLDVEIFFDLKLDTVVLIAKVAKDIYEHHVLMPKVLPSQPTLCPNTDTLFLFSSENEDKVFKHGILSYLLISHRDKVTSGFSENLMMMYGGDIPLLDVPYLYF
nr:hypothetical protein [Tanacetum cinerariifolium]